jgi:LAO/AO transport system kinase
MAHFNARRKAQDVFWFEESMKQQILDKFLNNETIQNQITLFKKQIQNGEISSFNAADKIIEQA